MEDQNWVGVGRGGRTPGGLWRDPELGAMLRGHRQQLEVTALSLSRAAWEFGVPLSCTEVHRIESGRRHPTPWHLFAWMTVLGLKEVDQKRIVTRWARAPRWQDVSWSSWRQLLAEHDRPVPVARHARPDRLHSTHRRVEVGSSFKLRLTPQEDVLLTKSAQFFGVRISDLVRDAVNDAVTHRRRAKPREGDEDDGTDASASESRARTATHNVRLNLSPVASKAIRRLSHGLELAPWVRLILLDDLESGRANTRYRGKGKPASPAAASASVAQGAQDTQGEASAP